METVFFDTGFTLLAPTRPVPDVYMAEARNLGITLDEETFRARLSDAWSRGARRSSDASLASSDAIEREGWRGLTEEVASPFPELLAVHDDWFARLVAWFDTPTSWRAIEGVPETLASLRSRGLLLGVVSNWHTALHRILEAHDLTRHFAFVLTSADVGWRKPHPAPFRRAIELSGRSRESAVHVGDSVEDDVLGARSAGIRPILIADSAEQAPDGTVVVPSVARLEEVL